ncbi:hypothetical protein J6590_061953, partial [Homalodisca vitripennis]
WLVLPQSVLRDTKNIWRLSPGGPKLFHIISSTSDIKRMDFIPVAYLNGTIQ